MEPTPRAMEPSVEAPEIRLRTICKRNGLRLEDSQISLLGLYVNLLLDWNKKINLISRKDESNIWENHILHSLSILFKLRLTPKSRVLDLGSGGGLPGIPLKIARPDLSMTLLDSTQKKVKALMEMTKQMSLDGVDLIWGRAEELGWNEKFFKKFDYVLARAVAPLKDLVNWSIPFLAANQKSGNKPTPDLDRIQVEPPALLTLKGGNLDEEVAVVTKQEGVRSVISINLVFGGSERIVTADKKIVIVKF